MPSHVKYTSLHGDGPKAMCHCQQPGHSWRCYRKPKCNPMKLKFWPQMSTIIPPFDSRHFNRRPTRIHLPQTSIIWSRKQHWKAIQGLTQRRWYMKEENLVFRSSFPLIAQGRTGRAIIWKFSEPLRQPTSPFYTNQVIYHLHSILCLGTLTLIKAKKASAFLYHRV